MVIGDGLSVNQASVTSLEPKHPPNYADSRACQAACSRSQAYAPTAAANPSKQRPNYP